jgi:hypothetical protein
MLKYRQNIGEGCYEKDKKYKVFRGTTYLLQRR